jgi:ABC-2 type transport system permease protein
MFFLLWASMIKYATLKTSGQSIVDLMNQFPHSIQAIFGMTGFDLTKMSGYYGVMFMYIALMATVHAVILGADIISKEERDRTSEFLFVKPISRVKVITSKIAAGLFNLIIFNLVTWGSSLYFVNYFSRGNSMGNNIAILMAGLFFLQLIFYFIGTVAAAIIKRPKVSSSVATSILLLTFILTIFININEKLDYLKYLTPFKYFDAKNLMASGHFDPVYVSISSILIVVMIAVTYWAYDKRDLSI